MSAVTLRKVSKAYRMGEVSVPAVADVSLNIRSNCFTVLSGPSGSGKTTLLNLIGALDRADAGDIVVAGQSLSALQDNALSDFRAQKLGFIFQNFNLLPVLTAYENVEYPLALSRVPAGERRRRVLEMLNAVGLSDKTRHLPGQLSGGQRQRVAIARALVHEPALVLADEPTANLDSRTGAAILTLLRALQRDRGLTVVFSSHDAQVMAAADEHFQLCDGRLKAMHTQREGAPA